MRVDLDFDFDFGDDPGHGPYLTLPTRVYYDDSHGPRVPLHRHLGVVARRARPAQVNQEDTDTALILRIGDPDIDNVSGVQTYHVSYTVDGWLNPANAQHSGDELYWNVIGAGWEIPLGDLPVAGHGPAAVEGAVCFAGRTAPPRRARPRPPGSILVASRRTSCPSGDQFSTVTGWPARDVPGRGADPRRQARPARARATGLAARRRRPCVVLVGGGVPRGPTGCAASAATSRTSA